MNKLMILALVVSAVLSVALTLAHVGAPGDAGGGGTHGIIAALL